MTRQNQNTRRASGTLTPLVLPPCGAMLHIGRKCGLPARYEVGEIGDNPTPVCSLHQARASTRGWPTRVRQNAGGEH